MAELLDRARAWVAEDPDPQTRRELEAYVVGERAARRGWAVHPNLITLLLLSPDFQVA